MLCSALIILESPSYLHNDVANLVKISIGHQPEAYFESKYWHLLILIAVEIFMCKMGNKNSFIRAELR